MVPAASDGRAKRSIVPALKSLALVAAIAAAALFAAPREAHALFEDQAFSASYESYVQSWVAWQSDGAGVEGNYHYWAAIYSYYGYYFAAYGDWYDYDPYFEYAQVYHDASSELWEALVFYGVGGYDSYQASLQARAAADWCYWAELF